MHGFKGERVLMRIHIGERDKFKGEPLYWAIVQLLRKRHYAGATVTRGIMGFGASSRIHAAAVCHPDAHSLPKCEPAAAASSR